MKQIEINPANKPYYTGDFIKGFECGTKTQFDADKEATNNAIIIPRGATNGDVIKKMISNAEIDTDPYRPSVDIRIDGFMMMRVDRNWWKAPYKRTEG